MDECAAETDDCDQNCTNTVGGFVSSCESGYLLAEDEKTCNDIDECAQTGESAPCVQVCTNTEGSFTCSCNDGYTYNGQENTCEDVLECQTDNGGCGEVQYINCQEEEGAAPTCLDINECDTNNGDCGDATYYSCTNEYAQPPTCADIDECVVDVDGNNGCGIALNWTCTNQEGTDPVCEDINECDFNNGACPELCINEQGAFPVRLDGDNDQVDDAIDNCVGVYNPEQGFRRQRHGRCLLRRRRWRLLR